MSGGERGRERTPAIGAESNEPAIMIGSRRGKAWLYFLPRNRICGSINRNIDSVKQPDQFIYEKYN